MRNAVLTALLTVSVLATAPLLSRSGTRKAESEAKLLGATLTSGMLSSHSVSGAFQTAILASGAPGGTVVTRPCYSQPPTVVHLKPGTLRQALESIVTADPSYRWEIDDGVVNLIPKSGAPALLRTRLPKYGSGSAAHAASAGSALVVLPEVRRREVQLGIIESPSGTALGAIAPGPHPPPKPIDVHCKDCTLFQILNAIGRAKGHGAWIYSMFQCGSTREFSLQFIE